MNSEAIMHEFVSRPKVNRLPFEPARSNFDFSYILDKDIIKWALLGMSSLVLLFVVYQYINSLLVRPSSHIDDARLMELINAPADPVNIAKPSDSTLYFRDSEGVIVGNMIRIASESEKMIPDKVYNSNGNVSTESELLSILSKY
jgi:hypothetical protein